METSTLNILAFYKSLLLASLPFLAARVFVSKRERHIQLHTVCLSLFLSSLGKKRFSLACKMVSEDFLVGIRGAFPLGLPGNG